MSDVIVTQEAPSGAHDHLEPDEIVAALGALSADDKLKLLAIEAVHLRGTGFARKALLHEATCRALLGERRCPRHVPIMAFLLQTMRSVASHDREQRGRTVQPLAGPSDWASEQLTPDEHLIEREAAGVVQTIQSLFSDDPEAQLVLMGWGDGLRGKELRDATGLDQQALDYAAKRVRSRMRKVYPNGWVP
jgi:DNA-directed RNA polymerase specialized sigma24 family protein